MKRDGREERRGERACMKSEYGEEKRKKERHREKAIEEIERERETLLFD